MPLEPMNLQHHILLLLDCGPLVKQTSNSSGPGFAGRSMVAMGAVDLAEVDSDSTHPDGSHDYTSDFVLDYILPPIGPSISRSV